MGASFGAAPRGVTLRRAPTAVTRCAAALIPPERTGPGAVQRGFGFGPQRLTGDMSA